jgi:MOSC domain-containing protein YiiM
MPSPHIEAIYIAPAGGAPMEERREVMALAGRGLEGDRYCLRTGTYSKGDKPKRQVTLIEAEALEAVRRDYGIVFANEWSRRNVFTRGAALNHLVGREFRAGEALLRGICLCEPCAHMASLCGRNEKLVAALRHRGGLNAEILNGGLIRAGDALEV